MDDERRGRWRRFVEQFWAFLVSATGIPGPCDSTPLTIGGQEYAIWQSMGVLRVGL